MRLLAGYDGAQVRRMVRASAEAELASSTARIPLPQKFWRVVNLHEFAKQR
jgi:hypothetical protein